MSHRDHPGASRSKPSFSCPWCQDSRYRGTLPTPRLEYLICRNCRSVTATQMETVDFEKVYRDHFPEGVRRDSPTLAERYGALLEAWEERIPVRRLLEVGCGNGQFLHVAKERGWEAMGLELSRTQVEHCRSRGLAVVYGDLIRDDLFPEGGFGLAVAMEVLEHVPDPARILQGLGERLVPGGGLHVTTPNATSLSRRILAGNWSVFDPEHVTLATPQGLATALTGAGLRQVEVQSRNVNVGEVIWGVKGRFGLRRGGGRARWGGPGPGGAQRHAPATLSGKERTEAAVRLRDQIDGSRVLRSAKTLVNRALALSGTGDTLVGRAVHTGGG
ncbi:MAG: class I SAM-dependent methyltransferase [Gemmatimonadota bacterium]